MGRLDTTNPLAGVSWKTVATTGDTAGGNIADHWHIYALGFHWIAFSANYARDCYLLKLDRDFNRVALVTVVQNSPQPTNDLFMVAEPDGVTVGIFLPGVGHTLYRFDGQGTARGTAQIGGGAYSHANGSSAIPIKSGFAVLATETLNPVSTSAVKVLVYDDSWRPVSNATLISQDRANYAMASGVLLESGYTIVNLRVRDNVNPRGVNTPPSGGDDSGSIAQLVVTPNGQVTSRQTLVAFGGNRPHTTLVGNLVITAWDGSGQAFMRIDRVN